eukprot:TRINITY_DN1148_c0_g1_i3.p1 TRINITY_DN1148_c0_g1~~TRINITY_DN1148_c0_g1_i3.p1  ORF type:complete len:423 (+),score=70.92 TRINITY_DN1148_c0_g1_i3:50-1270(+)
MASAGPAFCCQALDRIQCPSLPSSLPSSMSPFPAPSAMNVDLREHRLAQPPTGRHFFVVHARASLRLENFRRGRPCHASADFVAAEVAVKDSQDGEAAASTMTVAITGGSGFVGHRLTERLLADGHNVRIFTRSSGAAKSSLAGIKSSPGKVLEYFEPNEWEEALVGCTGVVNLAGTPISTRWSPQIKADILNSRVGVTRKIVSAINSIPEEARPKVLVSTSAIGFYNPSQTAIYTEESAAGSDYLAKVCLEWEAAARAVDTSTRLVIVRTGIVLDKDGGALAKMTPIFNLFAGGPLGSGQQWFSWIHRDDLVSLILEALANESYEGVVNGTAPNPVRLSELCDRLGETIARPSWLPVPEFAVKALLGEGACVVLDGQRVLPKRTQALGFSFKYGYVTDALHAIYK